MRSHAMRLGENPDARVVALCDVSEPQVRKFASESGLADSAPPVSPFTDPARMYAEAKLDAVFIATPHTMHYQHVAEALDAGLHVYVEKPMVTSSPDAYRLKEKVQHAGRILVIGYNTPCSPEFTYLRGAIQDRTHGTLEMVCGYLSQGWLKATKGLWRQEPELSGGGQAYDSGAHLLNSLCWSVQASVSEVFALLDNHGTAVDINSVMSIRFANGVLASIGISGNSPGAGRFMTFIFDRGRIDIDGWGGTWIHVFGEDGQQIKYPPITGRTQTPDDNFIDAILGRAEPRTNVDDGIIQSELMDAIYESARTGQVARPKKRD